jgi:hypothetical protein
MKRVNLTRTERFARVFYVEGNSAGWDNRMENGDEEAV